MRLSRFLPLLALIVSIGLLAVFSDSRPQPVSGSSFDLTVDYGVMANSTGSGGGGCDFAGTVGAATVRSRQGPQGAKRCTFTSFNLTNPDANFAGLITFLPQDVTAPCTFGHTNGPDGNPGGGDDNKCVGPLGSGLVSEIPNGAIVGKLITKPTLGLVNNACSTKPDLQFRFMAATTDTTNTFSYSPATQGLDNPMSPGHPSDATAYWPGYSDGATTNGAGDALNGIEAAVELYPSMLNVLFDPDGVGVGAAPIQPRARFFSHSFIVGTGNAATGSQVALQLLTFDPGALAVLPGASNLTANLGYPLVVILQDPTVPVTPSSVTDFCSTLLSSTITYGVSQDNPCNNGLPSSASGNGCPRSANFPALQFAIEGGAALACLSTSVYEGNCDVSILPTSTGTKVYRSSASGLRDAEDDGIENLLDPCPYSVDAGWSARSPVPTGDTDPFVTMFTTTYDGIPDSCDAVDSSGSLIGLADNDGDFFQNRQDICSNNANSFGSGIDVNTSDGAVDGDVSGIPAGLSLLGTSDIAFPNLVPDGSSRSDQIGARCDDSDRDAREGVHGTFGLRPKGSCVDGRDNDLDGLIDFNDPSCTTTIDGTMSDGDDLYDAFDDDDDNDGILDCGPDTICNNSDDDPTAARPNGHFHSRMKIVNFCVNDNGMTGGSPADSDDDGVCAGTTGEDDSANTDSDSDTVLDTIDNCIAVANTTQADMDVDGVGDFCDSDNTDGPAGPFILLDSDNDGFINAIENAVGTDPNAKCGGTFSWPADLAVGTEADVAFVDGTDLTAIAGQFGLATTAGGGTAPERFDLGPVSTTSGTLTDNKITDDFVDGTDLTAVAGQFGLKCDTP